MLVSIQETEKRLVITEIVTRRRGAHGHTPTLSSPMVTQHRGDPLTPVSIHACQGDLNTSSSKPRSWFVAVEF